MWLPRFMLLFPESLPTSIDILAEAPQQLSKCAAKTPIKSTLIVKKTEISWLASRRVMLGIVSLCHVWILNMSA